jgi:hypothetical protein
MSWEQSSSASFRARHASADATDAQRVLRSLEHVRVQLQLSFNRIPDEMTVVLHSHQAALALSNPLITGAWLLSDATSRRYVTGWVGRRELHVLSPRALVARAGPVTGSREMLRLSAAALYARRVIDENNPDSRLRLHPAGPLLALRRELRWAWLLEGGARWLAGQTTHARPSIARRLREGSRPAFPPGPRDAPLLGGTVHELLAAREGEDVVAALLAELPARGPEWAIERAFGARLVNVDAEWRAHLARISATERHDASPRLS